MNLNMKYVDIKHKFFCILYQPGSQFKKKMEKKKL